MDVSVNLKRRRDSGDSVTEGEEKNIKKKTTMPQPEIDPPSQPQPQEKTKLKSNAQPYLFHPHNHQQIHPVNLPKPHSPQHCLLFPRLQLRNYSPLGDQRINTIIIIIINNIDQKRTKSASNGYYFCVDILESPSIDHHLKKILNHLTSLKTIDQKNITNPYLFKCAHMVTTFFPSAVNRTKEFWRFIEEASRADIRLAEMEHDSLKEMATKCTGRVPIYVHPSFYRSLKLRYLVDDGGITMNDRVNTELGTGSLRQVVGILTPEDFWLVVASE